MSGQKMLFAKFDQANPTRMQLVWQRKSRYLVLLDHNPLKGCWDEINSLVLLMSPTNNVSGRLVASAWLKPNQNPFPNSIKVLVTHIVVLFILLHHSNYVLLQPHSEFYQSIYRSINLSNSLGRASIACQPPSMSAFSVAITRKVC